MCHHGSVTDWIPLDLLQPAFKATRKAIRDLDPDEVPAVLSRLLHDPELLSAIARLRVGPAARLIPAMWRPLVRFFLSRQLDSVTDVHGMQMVEHVHRSMM